VGNYIRNCDILSTFDVGAAGGNREDLLDLIVNIAPDETPFWSGLRKSTMQAVLHEWMVDNLFQAGDPDRGVLDVHHTPESSDACFPELPVRCRIGNRVHIFRKTGDVSDLQRAVRTAGVSDEYRYQVERAMKEWALLVEFAIIYSQANWQVAPQCPGDCQPSPGGIPAMDGLRAAAQWDTDDFNCLTADMQGTVLDYGDSPCTDLDPILLDHLNQLMWQKGAQAKNIWVNAMLKRRISQFYLRGHSAISQSDAKKLVNAIDVYESDFGMRRINLHRYIRDSELLMTDDDYLELAILQPVKQEILARIGNSTKFMIEGSLTGKWRSPAAIGWLFGLCTDIPYCGPCDSSDSAALYTPDLVATPAGIALPTATQDACAIC